VGRQPNFESTLEQRRQKQYPEPEESLYPWVVTPRTWLNNHLIKSITEIELERLESILRAIISEGEIMKKIERMSDIDCIEITQSKQAFEEGVKKLTKEIDDRHDDYLIKANAKSVTIGISKLRYIGGILKYNATFQRWNKDLLSQIHSFNEPHISCTTFSPWNIMTMRAFSRMF
jgi:hypothetical protein